MTNIDESEQIVVAPVITEGMTNVVQNFIPLPWLTPALTNDWKYVTVVKKVFIIQAESIVKTLRTMNASQHNLDMLMEYNALLENLGICYPRRAINKYMKYTTKTKTMQKARVQCPMRFPKIQWSTVCRSFKCVHTDMDCRAD